MSQNDHDDLMRRAQTGDRAAQLALADALDAEGRHADAISALSVAAQAGNAVAKGRVGARLLVGDRAPSMPPQGAGLVADAAREGSVEAAALLATLAAAGAYRAQSWSDALHWIVKAAEGGHASARAQVMLLSSDRTLAAEAAEMGADAPGGIWRRLRAGIDLGALFTTPEANTLCEAPLIRSYPGFAAPEICDWLIGRAAESLRRAEVYAGGPTKAAVSGVRTNTTRVFSLTDTDLVQLALQARTAAATGTSPRHMEAPTVLHYSPGEVFDDHYDFIDPGTPNYAAQIARYGERIVTFLIYLNEGYEGGETAFPRLELSHKGRRGEGMFFTNALPEGGPDFRALHAGRPPTSGEKWVVSQFVRSRPFVPGA